jgi:putative NADH-flavin reductase
MKIAVIGAAGKAGKLIAGEALARGHEVTAVVKPGSEDRAPKGCAILAKSLFDLTAVSRG